MDKRIFDTNGKPVVIGQWYCIGWMREQFDGEPKMQWDEILQWNGDGWYDNNERVTLFDCDLRMHVADDAADGYQPQA